MTAFSLSVLESASDDDSDVINTTPDLDAKGESEIVLLNEEQQILKDAIDQLEERERQVISMRFGLDNGKSKTLREVGETLDLTRERIRQIEREALSKLKGRLCPKNRFEE
jgi:RNA polymerase primary sigma factor